MLREYYYRLLVHCFMQLGLRIYGYMVARSRDQRTTSIHFAESEAGFNIAIREMVEELDESYKDGG